MKSMQRLLQRWVGAWCHINNAEHFSHGQALLQEITFPHLEPLSWETENIPFIIRNLEINFMWDLAFERKISMI